jgi:hypothetical protein
MTETEQISLFTGTLPEVGDGAPPVVDERPNTLESKTYRLSVTFGAGDVAIYLTVSDRDGRPFEFFLNCTNMELRASLWRWWRMTCKVLQARTLRTCVATAIVNLCLG